MKVTSGVSTLKRIIVSWTKTNAQDCQNRLFKISGKIAWGSLEIY